MPEANLALLEQLHGTGEPFNEFILQAERASEAEPHHTHSADCGHHQAAVHIDTHKDHAHGSHETSHGHDIHEHGPGCGHVSHEAAHGHIDRTHVHSEHCGHMSHDEAAAHIDAGATIVPTAADRHYHAYEHSPRPIAAALPVHAQELRGRREPDAVPAGEIQAPETVAESAINPYIEPLPRTGPQLFVHREERIPANAEQPAAATKYQPQHPPNTVRFMTKPITAAVRPNYTAPVQMQSAEQPAAVSENMSVLLEDDAVIPEAKSVASVETATTMAAATDIAETRAYSADATAPEEASPSGGEAALDIITDAGPVTAQSHAPAETGPGVSIERAGPAETITVIEALITALDTTPSAAKPAVEEELQEAVNHLGLQVPPHRQQEILLYLSANADKIDLTMLEKLLEKMKAGLYRETGSLAHFTSATDKTLQRLALMGKTVLQLIIFKTTLTNTRSMSA